MHNNIKALGEFPNFLVVFISGIFHESCGAELWVSANGSVCLFEKFSQSQSGAAILNNLDWFEHLED